MSYNMTMDQIYRAEYQIPFDLSDDEYDRLFPEGTRTNRQMKMRLRQVVIAGLDCIASPVPGQEEEEPEREQTRYRYVFLPGPKKKIKICLHCRGLTMMSELEMHARYHLNNGEFPNLSSIVYDRSTEIWCERTVDGGWAVSRVMRGDDWL